MGNQILGTHCDRHVSGTLAVFTADRLGSAILLGVIAMLCSGCGPGNPLGRIAVSGTVQLGGQPLDQGSIEFSPTEGGPNIASGGRIKNGRFRIPAHQGLLPGTYVVRISSAQATDEPIEPEFPGESPIVARERIPAEYNVKSDKQVTITKGGRNVLEFDIP